jgi:predicted transposase YbfD/YdcC
MNSNMLTGAMESEESLQEEDALSVFQAFEQVQDGRCKRGVRYSVAQILTLIVLGKLAGMTTPAGVAEWVRLRTGWLKQVLKWTRPKFPCASTYSNVLRKLDAEQVNGVLSQLLIRLESSRRCGQEPSRMASQQEGQRHIHLALDGKTLRGTLGHQAAEERPMHQLGLYETQTGVLLHEQIVGEKQNELSIVEEFLTPHWVKGRIISADAIHTQRKSCALIDAYGGFYLFIAKGNQSTLAQDLHLFFAEPPADCRDWRMAHTGEKGYGRIEQRDLVVTTELNDFLARDWIGVAQTFRLTRTIERGGKTHQEVVHGLTNLPPSLATADDLLRLQREHWAIENRLHYRRDVTLREDHCQVRKGVAPRVLAVLNSFLLGLLDFCGVTNVAQRMRLFDAQPWLALRLLQGSLLTFT